MQAHHPTVAVHEGVDPAQVRISAHRGRRFRLNVDAISA
jgi:hypothetical protein